MDVLEIVTAGPYNIFFLLAVAAGTGIAWVQGRRLGAPPAEWLALLALLITAGMLGGRLLHFDPGAGPGAKTILGAVLAATVVL